MHSKYEAQVTIMLANFFEWKQVDKLKHESLHLDEELEEGKMYFHSKEELSSPDT